MRGPARFRGTNFRHGILSRCFRLGYELGRERRSITANDILRAAITVEDADALPNGAALVREIIRPVLAETERTVSVALGRISIDDMVRRLAVPK